ncbi:MAG: replication-relaxation family protein [Dactylosporangium sp.]|nr:replication-relaxation family protein [Dactylosporangium sp.]NNJ63073.1 replication-relaxation family protein [Dactylosporangium sp.]
MVDDLVLRLQSSLTGRDLRLLGWLFDHGVLTTEQITDALFGSERFCQRRLLTLTRLGALTRFRPQRPDGGSYPYHYLLDQTGVEIIAAQRGLPAPRRDQARTRRRHLTGRANLAHLLGANEFFTQLAGYERTHPGSRLERWWPASRFHDRSAFFEHGGDPRVMLMDTPRPDGHGIWVQDGITVPFYLEHDTGSEAIDVLFDKIARYEALAAVTGRRWSLLLWLPTARRELHLHQRLASERMPRAAMATAARDHTTGLGYRPAHAVWWPHRRPGTRLTLPDLHTFVANP